MIITGRQAPSTWTQDFLLRKVFLPGRIVEFT